MFNPFKKKTAPEKPRAPIEIKDDQDWRIGDLALCLEDDWDILPLSKRPAIKNEVYIVTAVSFLPHRRDKNITSTCLALRELGLTWWQSSSFRKIDLVADTAPCSAEFAILITKLEPAA